MGGNKSFYDFISYYDTQNREIKVKYLHRSALYYQQRLRSQIDEQLFDLEPPHKEDWKDVADKARVGLEQGLVKSSDWVKEKWVKVDLGGKIKGLFKK
jgi:hypothetical protein